MVDFVRVFVLNEWGRWEGMEKKREREVSVVVEVEVNSGDED